MTLHYHSVVWLDHSEARIIHFNSQESDTDEVRRDDAHRVISM